MFSLPRLFSKNRKSSKKAPKQLPRLFEQLEGRAMMSGFSVVNLNDHGPGSLRRAINDANASSGADVITFNVAGEITLQSALPTVKDTVQINGASAPGFAGTPAVEVDFNGFGGLQLLPGASGSTIQSLALNNASTAGITLVSANNVLIAGNYVGLDLDGTTVEGNAADGIMLINSSNNTIGGTGASDANTISGNGANGIGLYASNNNQIVANNIGTDIGGTLDRGNAHNGILLTGGSAGNLIGGVATGGNDPTANVFVRPPQGNLISGNNLNGVMLTGGATNNQLSGNFIGTTSSGNAALGNSANGVEIVGANGNSLIGCLQTDEPFIYYNVVSGNGENGLRITNSNDTTIQANFFGIGADNNTAVGNGRNGVVVEGSSTRTTMGGPIPLGNVVAANTRNGIVVRDAASFFVSYNTFCGVAAFSLNPNLGNGMDGMLITSAGGNNLIRTNVISRNGDDGIEISGFATGVRVGDNIIGLNTVGMLPMGNVGNGVEIGGYAHHILIGGPQPTFSIIPKNIISGNGEAGVAVLGNANNNIISNGYIGTNVTGHNAIGNGAAGVLFDAGTFSNTIGSPDPALPTVISGNTGNGVLLRGTRGNTVMGSLIGVDADGVSPMGNGLNGVAVNGADDNLIGRVPGSTPSGLPANIIAFNHNNGVFVRSGDRNAIFGNSIHTNGLLGIDLAPGANRNQGAPILTSAVTVGQNIQITGIVTSLPYTTVTIEFFASNVGETSGRISLGSKLVKTNSAGVATYTFNGAAPQFASAITATATDLLKNTSEFSNVAP